MPHAHQVRASEVVYSGRVFIVYQDQVSMPGEVTSQRDVIRHPGAVGVVALDGQNRVLLVRQYRHPVARRLDELPAGLLDVEGEAGSVAAARELAEEAGYAADRWDVLVDALTSPGMTDEAIRILLARQVRKVPRLVQHDEELEMTAAWVPLDEAVSRVLSGQIENAMACLGLLAAAHAQRTGFVGLRQADTPWSARPAAAG